MEQSGMGKIAEMEASYALMNDRAKHESLAYQNHMRLRTIRNNPASNPAQIAALEQVVDQNVRLAREGKAVEELFKMALHNLLDETEKD